MLPSLEKTSFGRIRDALDANQKLLFEEETPDIDYINKISLLGLNSDKQNIYLDQNKTPVAFDNENIENNTITLSQDEHYEYQEIALDDSQNYYLYVTAGLAGESVTALKHNLYPHIAYQNFYEIAGQQLNDAGEGLYLFADVEIRRDFHRSDERICNCHKSSFIAYTYRENY